jgi:hypothetical protein
MSASGPGTVLRLPELQLLVSVMTGCENQNYQVTGSAVDVKGL